MKCLGKAHAPYRSTWKWPGRVDEHDYPVRDIGEPEMPKPFSGGNRNIVFYVPGLNSVGRYKLKIHTLKLIVPSFNLGIFVKFLYSSMLSRFEQISKLLLPLKSTENGF